MTNIEHFPTSDGLVQREVRVYRNLTKGCWSVQVREPSSWRGAMRWRVLYHLDALALRDATFRVSEAGRERVLAQKRKNVHAYVYGELRGYGYGRWRCLMAQVGYNPYDTATFVQYPAPGDGLHTCRKPIYRAKLVAFDADGKVRATRG